MSLTVSKVSVLRLDHSIKSGWIDNKSLDVEHNSGMRNEIATKWMSVIAAISLTSRNNCYFSTI